jgi:hypothetical protein
MTKETQIDDVRGILYFIEFLVKNGEDPEFIKQIMMKFLDFMLKGEKR